MAETLAAAGRDLLLVETMGRVDEAAAAVQAGQGLGLPVRLAVVRRADGACWPASSWKSWWPGCAARGAGAARQLHGADASCRRRSRRWWPRLARRTCSSGHTRTRVTRRRGGS